MKRPLGVTFISYFHIFGAVVLIITAIFFNPEANEFGIADRFGLPNFPEQLFRIILAVVSLFIICGYIRLKRWGFWLMITYSVAFGIISSLLITNQSQQPYAGNLIFSIIVVAYTIYVKKTYFHTNLQQ